MKKIVGVVILALTVLSISCHSNEPSPGPGTLVSQTVIDQPSHDVRKILIFHVRRYGVTCDEVWFREHRGWEKDVWHKMSSNLACAQFSLEEFAQ